MNDTEVSIKFKNSVTGEKKLEKYVEQLKTINACAKGMNTGSLKSLDAGASDLKSVAASTKSIAGSASVSKFSAALTIIKEVINVVKKLGQVMVSTSKKSFDFLENFNLFQVAFNGNYKSAQKFINKMAEMYGLDESWLTQTVGKFKQLSNAMSLTAETGEKVSKLLTEMSLDISSLYNVDIDRAASTLSSAMAGQTKPIRGVAGADITQATLQTTLDNLGIKEAVADLSFAEKRLLIIISLTQQLNASIGDMGRTIESPSNQMRIMNEQWERLTRAVGNLFLPILSEILPYLNAILMVLTEIISSIAALLGFDLGDYDYFETPAQGAWDLDKGLKSADKSAKKLKQGLRGFDKLNVITTPSKGGSGGGAGGIGGLGGINKNLLDAFNKAYDDYQNKLGKVKMKATEIRDTIMDWLGFTKHVNKETGEVYFKYNSADNKLYNIYNKIKDIAEVILGPINPVGINIYTILDKIIGTVKELNSPAYNKLDIFENLSEDTVNRLTPVQEAFENLKTTISEVSYDNLKPKKEKVKEIEDSINELTDKLKLALDSYIREQILNLNTLYKETGVIDKKEYDKRLKELGKYQTKETKKIDKQGTKLKNKAKTLYDEQGNLQVDKYADYLDSLDTYEKNSYTKFASGEEDKKTLQGTKLEDMHTNQTEYWSKLLEGYITDRDEAIKKAEEKRDKTIKAAEDTFGGESKEFDKAKKKAEETFEAESKKAKDEYDRIYREFKNSQGDIAKYIDKDTGKVLTKWQSFCNKIKDIFVKKVGDIEIDVGVSAKDGANALASAIKVTTKKKTKTKKKANGGVFTLNGSKFSDQDIRRYASGGLPPVGQMFVAREKGPELVGKIGSHTAIMNNDQIVSSVASGVYDAVYKANLNSKSAQSINPTIIVQVGNKEIAKQVITDLQDMAKTNGKPIRIGG